MFEADKAHSSQPLHSHTHKPDMQFFLCPMVEHIWYHILQYTHMDRNADLPGHRHPKIHENFISSHWLTNGAAIDYFLHHLSDHRLCHIRYSKYLRVSYCVCHFYAVTIQTSHPTIGKKQHTSIKHLITTRSDKTSVAKKLINPIKPLTARTHLYKSPIHRPNRVNINYHI